MSKTVMTTPTAVQIEELKKWFALLVESEDLRAFAEFTRAEIPGEPTTDGLETFDLGPPRLELRLCSTVKLNIDCAIIRQ